MITVEEHPTVIRVYDGGLCLAEASLAEASQHGKRWACTTCDGTTWVKDRAAAEAWVRKVYLAAGGAP